MKNIAKVMIFILSVAMLLSLNHSTAQAATDTISSEALANAIQTTITYDDDGGYCVETLEIIPIQQEMSTVSADTSSTTTTKKGIKTKYHFNSNNTLCWSYSLTAIFTVKTGISATYKSSTASLDNAKSWSIVSESHSGSGSKATGTIQMQNNGITISKTITIHCDRYGNFS